MSDKKPFYITTTLPYVNAELHAGHAAELIRADAIARYRKLQGFGVFFNSGTDEHGKKILEAAEKAGKAPKEYADIYSEKFKENVKQFGLDEDILHVVHTTDESHKKAAQEFWKRCDQNGYIYKKNYQTKYCVSCEEEKSDSELINGRCALHPDKELELIDEENYFFKYSAFSQKLLDFYKENPNFIIPEARQNEMVAFAERGLQDFSISRLKAKMSWGVEVPGDSDHVMYVWFDALTSYISTLGWPENEQNFERFWKEGTPIQYCGKDNTRFQGAMWQAMLMAADLPNTHKVIVNGFILSGDGTKMSKSLGNVINPVDIVTEYGTEALRYFVLRELNPFEDSPFGMERFKEAYNSGLANGLGNLTSRIMKMAEVNLEKPIDAQAFNLPGDYKEAFEAFNIQRVAEIVWHEIAEIDRKIQEEQPFKIIKVDKEKGQSLIIDLVSKLYYVAVLLKPLLPQTSEKIISLIELNKSPETPLFLRKD